MALMARNPSLRLRQAVQKNDLNLVMRLRHKTDLRNTDEKRLTSLAWAALSVAEDVYEWLLLDAGHDDDELSRDSENSTILHLLGSLPSPDCPATEKQRLETYQAAVRMTNMYWDVFPDLIDWSNSAGKTALHMACQSGNTELVRTLCELGADVQLTDLQGNSPLHYASAWNNLGCIKVLLEYGAPASSRNNEAFSALDYAFSTTLAREFALAIREANEERRARRNNSQLSNTGGPSTPSYFRTLANKGSFMTVFSDEVARSVGTPPDPSTPPPPQFHLTTPEPRSPSGSMWSLASERPSKGMGQKTGGGGGSHRMSLSTPKREESPMLSPTQTPGGSSISLSQEPRRLERSLSSRSSPSAGRSRANSSLGPGSARPIVPALYIPETSTQQRDRQRTAVWDTSDAVFIDSPSSMRSPVPPPMPRSAGLDGLALGRPL